MLELHTGTLFFEVRLLHLKFSAAFPGISLVVVLGDIAVWVLNPFRFNRPFSIDSD